MNSVFPFTGISGMEDVKLSLLTNLIDPGIGGVLISGEKGCGKSTLVRSIPSLLPEVRLVNLPLNATMDRVVGSLRLEAAVKKGRRVYEPGLLAEAHGAVLYVDEINLLDAEIQSVVLSTAATGRVKAEREGFSHEAPARFSLVGTMNPEEGPCPPQLLDRFGHFVAVHHEEDPKVRKEIVKNRLAYEAGFLGGFLRDRGDAANAGDRDGDRDREKQEEILREKLRFAREHLLETELPEDLFREISEAAERLGLEGQRGEIAAVKTVRALAALRGKSAAGEEELNDAIRLSFPHRLPRGRRNISSKESKESKEGQREQEPQKVEKEEKKEEGQRNPARAEEKKPEDHPENRPEERQNALSLSPELMEELISKREKLGEDPGEGNKGEKKEKGKKGDGGRESLLFEIGRPLRAPVHFFSEKGKAPGIIGAGRRWAGRSGEGRGRYSGTRSPRGRRNPTDIAVDATLRNAAPYQTERRKRGEAKKGEAEGIRGILVERRDILEKRRKTKTGAVIIFCVDGSASMGAHRRMAEAKGAVFSLLLESYQKRDTVGMVVFREKAAEVVLPPTRSVDRAHVLLKTIPTGGKTPLAEGLRKTGKLCSGLRAKDRRGVPYVVVVTDGKNNVALGREDPEMEIERLSRGLSKQPIRFIVIDTETGWVRLGKAKNLADRLGAVYVHLDAFSEEEVVNTIHTIIREEQ